jgi:protein-disulfide isomerase
VELGGRAPGRDARRQPHLRRPGGADLSLTSAPVPPLGPDDHVRGPEDAPLIIVYADFACPHCAVLHGRIREAGDGLRVAFRHFALKAKRPRAPVLAAAAEAAALQGAFWPMHDALYADQGRQDDPHLWERAERLGLDVERFEADRRSDAVAERVRRDVRGGMRAGVVETPTLVARGALHAGQAATAILLEVRK